MPITVIFFVLPILLLSFGFGALAIRWDHEFKLNRERIRAEGAGNSLGTSELRALIQDVMMEAVAPVEERLELIERHMRQLPEHASEAAEEQQPQPDDPEDR